jgi:dihydroorotate dehydrogenase (NAD+) catalytic subunit
MVDLHTRLGAHHLRTPLVAASGTVGSVVDCAAVSAFEAYGAAVAKSVSAEPWQGRPAPRLAPVGEGMLNGIGIQNPGIAVWVERYGPALASVPTQVWGSTVGTTPTEFAEVAAALAGAGAAAIEVNLSCPNLEQGRMFALDPDASAGVVAAVRGATGLPVGAKLSPNAADITAVAGAVAEAGADWVVLTNTAWGAAIDVETRRPALSGSVGGYSGPGLKPIALRCVWEVRQALPGLPIVGCGGVRSGRDVVEYLMAGASAVAIGTSHLADPRCGIRIRDELKAWCRRHDVGAVADLVGSATPW